MRKTIIVAFLCSISTIYGGYITQALLDKMASVDSDELIRINILM